MSARQKQTETPSKKRTAASSSTPPEAHEHYDDVRADVVKLAREKAKKVLKKGRWVVVDGYVDK